MYFYQFRQNNSGGSCIDLTVGGVTAHHFWVAADNAADANKIFSITVGFNHSFCPCCGERFSEKWNDEKPDFIGSIDDLIAHQRNREFFSEFQKNCAVILDPLGKNVIKIDLIDSDPFHIGKFRAPIKSLLDGVPEEKDFYFLGGKLYDWDWDHTRTNVVAEVKSASEAVQYLMNNEYVPGKYSSGFDSLVRYAKDYDRKVVNNFYLFRHIEVKEFFGLNIMSVGGAVSVDKMGDTTHVPHWNGIYHEAITEWFKMGKPQVDIIVTHEAPNKSGLHPNPVIAEKYGVTSELGSQELRDLITEVGPKIQINGHHHTWNNCQIGTTDCWTLPIPFCSSAFWNSLSLSGYGVIDVETLRFTPTHMIDGVDY